MAAAYGTLPMPGRPGKLRWSDREKSNKMAERNDNSHSNDEEDEDENRNNYGSGARNKTSANGG